MLLQNAKENAQQVQIERRSVLDGFDETKAREMFYKRYDQTRVMFTKEAEDIARTRVAEFEKVLMEKIRKTIGKYSMFRDPWFYRQLAEAQKASATSGLYDDYDLLASLLLNKYLEGGDDLGCSPSVINQTIKAIRNMSEQTLVAFTVICSIDYIHAQESTSVLETISYYENRYRKLLSTDLPELKFEFNNEVQVLNLGTIHFDKKDWAECEVKLFSTHHKNLIDVGIKKDSKQYTTALDIIRESSLCKEIILVEHELDSDCVRIALGRREDIEKLDFLNSQKSALHRIFDLYERDETMLQKNLEKLSYIWQERPVLKKISTFYNCVGCITPTKSGIYLTVANLSRLNLLDNTIFKTCPISL